MPRPRITNLLMALRHYVLVLIHPGGVDPLDANEYRLVCKVNDIVIYMLFVPGYDDDEAYNMLPGVVTKSRPMSHYIYYVLSSWSQPALYHNAIHK